MEKWQKGFLWRGWKEAKGGHCLLTWPKVARAKELGGSGMHNIKCLGWALRGRWLWLQKSEPDKPWAMFPIKTCRVVESLFSAAVVSEVGDGTQTLFSKDRWLHGKNMKEIAPLVYAKVPKRKVNSRK